jgi:hypothetical protein
MTLTEYIKQVGVPQFCKEFGIKERTATAYRYRQRRPRPALSMQIIDRTPVTWEGIYGSQSKAS